MPKAIPRLLAALVLSACLTPAHAGKVVIGHVGPFSGQLSEIAQASAKVFKSYFDDVNAKGGISGNKIQIVTRDDAFNNIKFVEQARDIIANEKPVAFIGAAGCGGVNEATKQKVFEEANVPLLAPICGQPNARQGMHVFHIRASWPEELQKLVAQMQSLGRSRVGIFYQNDPDGRLGMGLAKSYLKKAEIEVVATGGFEKGSSKVEGAVKSIGDQNPDTVLMIGPNEPVSEFVKQYRNGGNTTSQLYTISVVDARDLVKAAGVNAARGTGISQVMPFLYSDTVPIAKEFRAFAKKHGIADEYIEFEYYIASKLLHEALKKAGPEPTGEKVIKGLESIENLDLGGGYRVNFGPGNRVASKFVEITLIGATGRLIK